MKKINAQNSSANKIVPKIKICEKKGHEKKICEKNWCTKFIREKNSAQK